MKEIVIAIVAIVVISFAASYGLDSMNWTAENRFASGQVRL